MSRSNQIRRIHGEYFTIEVWDDMNGIRHRLVCNKTGKHTKWAAYTQITCMDTCVGVSPYYTGGFDFELMDSAAFVQLMAVK